MASTQWRVVGLAAIGGGDIELCAAHLYDASVARLDATATLACTVTPTSGALANLQDADTATLCRFSGAQIRASGFALSWTFASAVDASFVRLGGGASRAEYAYALALEALESGQWVRKNEWSGYPWPGANTMVAVLSGGDAYWSNVIVLMHADDAVDSTSPADSSSSPKTITCYGGAKVATKSGAFGGKALYVPSGGRALIPHSAATDFVSTNWCIEFDYWPAASPSASQILLNKANDTGAPYPVQILVNASGVISARSYDTTPSMVWQITTSSAITVNARNTIALSRQGSAIRLFLDGALIGSTSYSGSLPSESNAISIGGYSGGGYTVNGHIDELRITIGAARRTAAYTVDSAAFPDSGGGIALDPVEPRLRVSVGVLAASSPVPAARVRSNAASRLARDMEFGGAGTITGQTLVKDGGPEVPTRARVRLLRARDGVPARETWSDPVTGAYSFAGLDTAQQFVALAQKPDGAYEPVAGGPLTPQVL